MQYDGPQNSVWNTLHVVALRCGWMSMAQLPPVIALTGRNSLVQFLTGIEYNHLRFMHKLLAVWMAVLGLIHTIDASMAQLQWFGGNGVEELYLHNYLGQTGIAVRGCHCSLPRTRTYSFWRTDAGRPLPRLLLRLEAHSRSLVRALPHRTRCGRHHDPCRHHLPYVALLLLPFDLSTDRSLTADVPALKVWLYVPLAFWIFERVARALQLVSINLLCRFKFRAPLIKARATLIEGAVVLHVPFKGEWAAGQHAYLSFWDPSFLSTPWIYFQSHPFSIANVPSCSVADEKGRRDMLFVMRTRDGMTKTLAHRIAQSPTGEAELWMTLEGPYGGCTDTEQFHNVLLIAGGSGISHVMSSA